MYLQPQLLLVLVSIGLQFIIASEGASTNQPLFLLSFANSEDSVVNPSEGLSLTISAQLAIDLINNRSDILPDHELTLISKHGSCTSLDYVPLFEDFIYSEKNIAGILGPGCSEFALSLGSEVITRSQLQTLSVGVSGTEILEQNRFENSFSTLDSSRLFAPALLRIIADNNWKRIFIIYDSTMEHHTKIFQRLNSTIPRSDDLILRFAVLHNSTLEFEADSTPPDCFQTPRIFIIIAGPEVVTKILCYFYYALRFISYPTYQFVVVGNSLDTVIANISFEFVTNVRTPYECSAEIIEGQLNGSIFLNYHLEANSSNTISGLSHLQFVTEYNRKIQEYKARERRTSSSLTPSFYAAPFFDSVWALALALNGSASDIDISDYHYGDTRSTDIIREQLFLLDFPGVSGRIRFARNKTFVPRSIDIFQVQNKTLTLLEYYSTSDDRLFAYGPHRPDYINDRFQLITRKSLPVGIVLVILVGLISLVLIGFQVLSVIYVKHPSIRATSPILYHLTYIACYVLMIACLVKTVAIAFNFSAELENECMIDQSAEFLFGASDVLLYSTLAAISFRIYRIFVYYMNPGKIIQDGYLISFILIITLSYVACDAVTIALTPLEQVTNCLSITGSVMTVDIVCSYASFQWFRVPIVLFPILPSVLACVFSIVGSEKVSIKKFKTASFTLLCFIAYLNVATLTLFFLTNSTPATPELVIASKLMVVICCILLLYLPPSWSIFQEWYTGNPTEYSPNPTISIRSSS